MVGDDVAVMYAGRLVETGPAEQVLTGSRHPYTAALLNALPMPGIARGALQAIPGQPPAPGERPWENACAFAPRCTFATAACGSHRPPMTKVDRDQFTACDVIADRPPWAAQARSELTA
jgi:oligopeptide/dipeptide ABC transporter ATP-binding protein